MSAKKPMISMNEPLIKKILEERKCIYETCPLHDQQNHKKSIRNMKNSF